MYPQITQIWKRKSVNICVSVDSILVAALSR
ncbi:MAG: hypothetical protein DRP64_06370 [Verrucomicrobia bacterium]|nr:MAG: hypothetical protein DRP64_06370 [Verrucomicrobiota bacterium]